MSKDFKYSYKQLCWEAALRNYKRRAITLKSFRRGISEAADGFLDRLKAENDKLEQIYPMLKGICDE